MSFAPLPDEKPETLKDIILYSRVVAYREEEREGVNWIILTLETGYEIHFRDGAVIVHPMTC